VGQWQLGTAVILMVHFTFATTRAEPTTPTSRPAEVRAERELAEQVTKLDAEYRTKKADILRRYVSQLSAEKAVATRAGNRAEAQRLYEKMTDANARIAELVPPPAPAAQRAGEFSLRISDFHGAAGFTNVVNVTLTEVSVTAENDFGRPPKVIWEARLTAQQQDRLAKFLRTFPIDQIRDSYVDPHVFDGYQVFFTIRLGNVPTRKITVANQRQRDLEGLIDEVNELLPPKYWVSKMGR
jgi:hypothetical protein